jgi:predicted TIM-barrel fold metal-dependent hydrolase
VIIDAHCHAGKGDIMTAPWNTDAPLEPYLQRARRAGIQKTVVFPAFHSDYAKANAALAMLIRHYSSRLIGFAFVHCTRDAGHILAMVRQAVLQWGFRGIKVHSADAAPSREVCEVARLMRVPVLVDIAGNASLVEMFAPQYPDVKFIIPHLGSFVDDWHAQQEVINQLVRFPNVYADTSGVRRFDYLVQAVQRAGPGKLIFGSDGPWLHPALELHKIRLLGLGDRDEALVTGGNISKLLGRVRMRQIHFNNYARDASPRWSISKANVENLGASQRGIGWA